MGSALYESGRRMILDANDANSTSFDINANNIKCGLIDLDQYGVAVSGCTGNGVAPIVITTPSAHGYTTGDIVTISGVGGNTNANGVFSITVLSSTTFSLQDQNTLANITGNGAYTSGGHTVNLTAHVFLSDIPIGARVSASGNLTSKTTNSPRGGVFDAADVTFSSVPAGSPCEAVVIFKDTGTASTSPLIAFIDTATGLPVTPNGADIQIQWDNGRFRIFML